MLECRHLSKEFTLHVRGGRRVVGFRDLTFAVGAGEFLGVSGPSGAGKSSLLKCLYRTYLPAAGQILYTGGDGEIVDLACADERRLIELRRREIGYVSQFFQVIPRVSALETVVRAAAARGLERQAGERRARELLERLGIPSSLWSLFPSTFSGGERQRINIVRAVVVRPRLLLLDEPTASLDRATAAEVVRLIRELQTQGSAVVGVFHDLETLKRLEDRRLEVPLARCDVEDAMEVVA